LSRNPAARRNAARVARTQRGVASAPHHTAGPRDDSRPIGWHAA